jgi:hypothetical protein
MAHIEVYLECTTLIYYTHDMVHTEVYIQCITLIYYTHDMVQLWVWSMVINLHQYPATAHQEHAFILNIIKDW